VKLTILCVGKLKEDPERALVARYLERFGQIGAGLGFGAASVTEIAESRALTSSERKTAEAAELKRRVGEARIVALDERGRGLTSEEFAYLLRDWRDAGIRSTAFVLGGPDGLDSGFAKEAYLALSLGRLTMPHGLARVVLAEQVYRAATILARHPYHRA